MEKIQSDTDLPDLMDIDETFESQSNNVLKKISNDEAIDVDDANDVDNCVTNKKVFFII